LNLKKKKIGILGGSFDPAHKGHLAISKEAVKRFKLKKIIWAITKKNPFKKQSSLSLQSRIKGCKKIIKKNKFIKWEIQDVLEINDHSKKFDGICMSYGLRNLNNVEEGIKKVFYLLKDKGRAGFLDFNHSTKSSLSNIFQKIYLRFVVLTISRLFNLGPEYAYIEKSIRNFPKKNELIKIAKEVGFKKAEYRTILGGQMGILILVK